MPKFEIYHYKGRGEEPIMYDVRMVGSKIQLITVSPIGDCNLVVAECFPGQGMRLVSNCIGDEIGMPIDEQGRVKIID